MVPGTMQSLHHHFTNELIPSLSITEMNSKYYRPRLEPDMMTPEELRHELIRIKSYEEGLGTEQMRHRLRNFQCTRNLASWHDCKYSKHFTTIIIITLHLHACQTIIIITVTYHYNLSYSCSDECHFLLDAYSTRALRPGHPHHRCRI